MEYTPTEMLFDECVDPSLLTLDFDLDFEVYADPVELNRDTTCSTAHTSPLIPPNKFVINSFSESLATKTDTLTDWPALQKHIAKLLRVSFSFSDTYLSGFRYIARRLVIGETATPSAYIVRIPLIPNENVNKFDRSWWTDELKRAFAGGIATTRWVHLSSGIPTQQIVLFDTGTSSPAGMPWVLMKDLPGHYCDLTRLGKSDQPAENVRGKIMAALAYAQHLLSRCTMPKIGVLTATNVDLTETRMSPLPGFEKIFSTTAEYLDAWTQAASARTDHYKWDPSNAKEQEYIQFPKDLQRVLPHLLPNAPPKQPERFPLIANHILWKHLRFDDQFNFVGLVDWEDTWFGPFESFVARTCGCLNYSEEMGSFEVDPLFSTMIQAHEADYGSDNRLSGAIGKPLVELGVAMFVHEKLLGIGYTDILERALKDGRRFGELGANTGCQDLV